MASFFRRTIGRVSQRAGKVMHKAAFGQAIQDAGACPDKLKNNRYRAGPAVKVRDGQGNTLTVLCGAQDDNLSGPRLCRHQRGLDFHQSYRRV
jgi:hypothetical protein